MSQPSAVTCAKSIAAIFAFMESVSIKPIDGYYLLKRQHSFRPKMPYDKFLRGRDTIKGAHNGLLPHGYRRYTPANVRLGFPNSQHPTPRYWFQGHLISRLG